MQTNTIVHCSCRDFDGGSTALKGCCALYSGKTHVDTHARVRATLAMTNSCCPNDAQKMEQIMQKQAKYAANASQARQLPVHEVIVSWAGQM